MSFDLTGKLIEKFDTVQVNDTFKKREFVLEKVESANDKDYVENIKFQTVQDKCDSLDAVNVGDEITVSFNIKGRRWENAEGKVNYFNNLDAWRVQKGEGGQSAPKSASKEEDTDDLPF